MASDFNLQQAQVDPDASWSNLADVTPSAPKVVTKTIPEQSWSVVQALRFSGLYAAGLRDPAILAAAIADSLAPAVDLADGNQETLDADYAESAERRAELGLEVVDSSTYMQQRDPRLLEKLALDLLNAAGLESELGDDLTQSDADESLVGLADTGVLEVARTGATSPQEARAREIAAKLGLSPAADDGYHAVVPEVMAADSTDPYIKKVAG